MTIATPANAMHSAAGPGSALPGEASASTDHLLEAAIALVSANDDTARERDAELRRREFLDAYKFWIRDHASVAGSPGERMEKVRLVTVAAAGAANLAGALEIMLRFGRLVTAELSPSSMSEEADAVILRFDRARRAGAAGLISELWPLSLVLSQLECLVGRPLGSAEGTVRAGACLPEAATALFFDRPLLFGQPALTLRLPKRYLQCAVVAGTDQAAGFQPSLMPDAFGEPDRRREEFRSLLRGLLRLDGSGRKQMTTLKSACERLGCSPATLRRRLAAEGSTFRQLRDEANDDRAKRLLLDGRLSVGEVAERLGFSDAFSFARFFARLNGCTPAAYRRRLATGEGER